VTEKRSLTKRLTAASSLTFVFYAGFAGFSTYFCMYAFRKPFAAATFSGAHFLGTAVDLKTAFVISQILGYALSKYIGVKVCSEATRERRAWLLVGLILCAESALLLFALTPPSFGVVALFLNGLSLGMVWGLVVGYLEGRRNSEVLLAMLSCSFIVSSGIVKDVGRWLITCGVSESWMPFTVGLLFLPPFLASVWFLNRLPPPNAADEAVRVRREPMNGRQRRDFVRRFLPGLTLLIAVYLLLTAYRDFRDNFGVELFDELGYRDVTALFTRTELVVAFGVMAMMALLNLIADNRLGLLAAYGFTIGGLLLTGIAMLLLDLGFISGFVWTIAVGFGAYLAYVPYNSLFFDRLMAWTRTGGTAVFAISLADAAGYTGSVGVQLIKDLAQTDTSRLEFFRAFTYGLSVVGTVLLAGSCWFFLHRPHRTAIMKKTMSNDAVCEFLFRLFCERGSAAYLGESVSQTEHALQTAWAAERAGADSALIVAALLHDIGHLLHDWPVGDVEVGVDGRHEEIGASWLEQFFGPNVTRPIRLHVAAKRYLCTVDPAYLGQLSEASVLSLKAQGGPFTPEEAEAFRADPYSEAALTLRCWDETAKVKDLPTPDIRHFLSQLESTLAEES
jgi:phosphonate degradation associated HDIG domain protein